MLMALSLSGALLGGTAVWAEEAVTTPTSEVAAASTSPATATTAEAPVAETPAAPAPAPTLDTGDTSWILVSTALVLLMTIPGLALFYGGMVRKKCTQYDDVQPFSCNLGKFAVGDCWLLNRVLWHRCIFGDLSKAMLNGVAFDALSGTIPESLFVIFQMTFAIITVAILSGSIADRMKYSAFMVFIAVWVLVVYAPITHWVWAADGWLFKAGALDFAGGTVVHINSGVAGLVAAYMLGKRIGLGRESMAPHNLTLTVVGASLLWVGWFGFNGGSALGAGARASMAILVTQVAAAAAAFSWLVVERMIRGKASVLGGASGAVAGLVVITPAAGFVGVGGALVMGLIGGVVCFWGITALKRLLKADDALDAFGLHAVGGIVGAILTGVFYSDEIIKAANVALAPTFAGQLWVQVEGVLATMVYSGIATFVILKVIDLVIGIRVNADDERMGLDLSQHGERIE